jgi:microcystin-dependent protein
MSTPFLGQIALFGFGFAPRGWALCQGQILSIAQNTALFALLGTTYGGNGQTTFGLPDLRGRVANGQGQGPGLSNYVLGEVSGSENMTLTQSQMPVHTHTITLNGLGATANVKDAPGNQRTPVGNVPAIEAAGVTATYSSAGAPFTAMAPGAITVTGTATAATAGSSVPFSMLNPFVTLNYCIALEGIFPSRN